MGSIPFYAKRFISGTDFTQASSVIETLNSKKITVTLDVLGENIKHASEAVKFTEEYETLLNQIAAAKYDCYVSVKLTMLGLDIDPELCYENFSRILRIADKLSIRVAMDMEDSSYTDRTLQMYERAAKEFKSPEIVLQAYLHRTEADIDRVLAVNGRVRLCKGAYKETAQNAIQKMPLIVENYKKLIQKLLLQGTRACIASHDDAIIDFCTAFIEKNKIPRERYEFQMLYGMREKTWSKIRGQGHNMTIYVPYGESWQAYYSRRLMERKENVFFVLKNFFKS